MAGKVAPNIVTSGLVLYLDAANPESYVSGSTAWNDISRGGNNGTLVNGPTFNSGNGGSIVFDGVDDLVTVPDTPTLNTTSGTISVWFFNLGTYTTSNQAAEIVNKHTAVGSLNGYGITLVNSSGTINAGGYVKNATTNYSLTLGSTILPSVWYNVTLTFQTNNQLIFYTNGTFSTSISVGSLTTNTQPLRIGTSNDTFWSPFNGRVATTQIYNRALSATEVLQNYNATKTRFGL
jgi:hypothetical protein